MISTIYGNFCDRRGIQEGIPPRHRTRFHAPPEKRKKGASRSADDRWKEERGTVPPQS